MQQLEKKEQEIVVSKPERDDVSKLKKDLEDELHDKTFPEQCPNTTSPEKACLEEDALMEFVVKDHDAISHTEHVNLDGQDEDACRAANQGGRQVHLQFLMKFTCNFTLKFVVKDLESRDL